MRELDLETFIKAVESNPHITTGEIVQLASRLAVTAANNPVVLLQVQQTIGGK